jgi:hypothetical protein
MATWQNPGYADALSPAQIATQMATFGRVDNPYGTSPGAQQGQYVVGPDGSLQAAPPRDQWTAAPPPPATDAPPGIVNGGGLTPAQIAARHQMMLERRQQRQQPVASVSPSGMSMGAQTWGSGSVPPPSGNPGMLVDSPQKNPVLAGTINYQPAGTTAAMQTTFAGAKPPSGIVQGGGIKRFGYN